MILSLTLIQLPCVEHTVTLLLALIPVEVTNKVLMYYLFYSYAFPICNMLQPLKHRCLTGCVYIQENTH